MGRRASTLTASRRGAAAAGFLTCASQLVGFYAVAHPRGVGTSGSLVAFWTACAIVGGPVFGIAGHLWRTGAVWIVLGIAFALASSHVRVEQLRWLGLTVPLGIAGELALTGILHGYF